MIDNTHPVTSMLAPSFLPSTAVLEMTYRCNHKCLFCSCPWENLAGNFQQKPELSTSDWKEVVERLVGMGVTSIAFTGGEPLLKDGLFDIIEYSAGLKARHIETVDCSLVERSAPPKLFLLSNGTEVDDSVFDLCKRHDVQLSMSLPGLSTFRDHTQAGDPDTILENFGRAKAKDVPCVQNTTVTGKNIHELYETLSAGMLAGADLLLMNRFLPGGRGLRYAEELMLSNEQIVEMLDTAETVLRDANRNGSVGTELPKCIFDPAKYERLEVGTRCSAAISFFVLGPSGYVRTCNHSPIRLSHFSEIDKVKTDPYWRRFTQKEYLPDDCSGCGMTGDCDGGCREAAHITGGELDALDPSMVGTTTG